LVQCCFFRGASFLALRHNHPSDLKDLALVLFGFVLFVTPMILVMVEGIRCAFQEGNYTMESIAVFSQLFVGCFTLS
jgi:hypothetical protein